MDVNIWFPESLYFGGLAYSVVLMTTSLLFYHMTKTHSLEMDPRISAIFAILLMFVSIIFAGSGISIYYTRLNSLESEKHYLSEVTLHLLEKERGIYWFYFILGILYMIIEILICYYIVKGVQKK